LLANQEWKIFELGSGGSTIFFSRRFKSVKSLDFSQEWSEKVKAALPKNSNVTLLYGEFDYLMNIVKSEPDEYYDIVLLDIGRHDKYRYALGEEVKQKIRIGGYLVVDNYDSKYMNRLCYGGFQVYTFDDLDWSSGGTRICIKRYNYAKRY